MSRLLCALSLLCVTSVACADDPKPTEKPSKELLAVRDWLKENTQTGKWEEVKWWGAIQPFKEVPGSFVRLKFRSANKSGATALYDYVFYVHKDKVEVRNNNSHKIYFMREHYFEGKK